MHFASRRLALPLPLGTLEIGLIAQYILKISLNFPLTQPSAAWHNEIAAMNTSMQKPKQKFYIIGHNAADTIQALRPWIDSNTSHLEIDVQKRRKGFVAQHSRVWGMMRNFPFMPHGVPLEQMLELVVASGKDIYIDYKWGNVEDLVAFLDKRQILDRTTFVIYGRHRAEELKKCAPHNDVFLHVSRFHVKIFEHKKNNVGIGVCLSAKMLTNENVAYMKHQDADILATFVNSFSDFMRVVAMDVVGITTDIPHIASYAHQYSFNPPKDFTPAPQFVFA
jgi:hypothetical protein